MMERSIFIHAGQDEAYSQYEGGVMFQEDIERSIMKSTIR